MQKIKSLINRVLNAVEVLGFVGILKLVKLRIELYFLKNKVKNSHSQLFEDYYLYRFSGEKKTGFYIDIGANDANNLNNTAFFYEKGWSGINVEPDMEKFNQLQNLRPKDLNINMGAGSARGVLKFYRFKNDSLSTFVKKEATRRESEGEALIGEADVPVDRLVEILNKYVSPNKTIDFMSIDVEGLNFEVLSSNDWNKFRPNFVCIEVADYCQNKVSRDAKVIDFLKKNDYAEVFFNGINSIFKDNKLNG